MEALAPVPHVRTVIIGTGFGGIGMAARLRRAGHRDFVVFERAGSVGGVWRDNRYPGAACDVQSHLYAFSFAPNPAWTRRFSPQAEIWTYLHDVAEREGVLGHVRFGHEVREAAWDERAARWRIETGRGAWTADVLVAAPGSLAEPRLPPIPGLGCFEGRVLHTSRWDPALPLDGLRVAVVGTGASAIQVVPAIQPRVGHLTVFQRTPPWVMARRDGPHGRRTRHLLRSSPGLHRAFREAIYRHREGLGLAFWNPALARVAEGLARLHLRRQVKGPALRRALTPAYRFGCKRVLLSDDYYPALQRPNVTLVPGPLVRATADALVGSDGQPRPTDVVVFATGFEVTDLPLGRRIRGRDGRALSDVWAGSPAAHVGTTVHGFPNFFLLSGPNTGLGHNSVILMIEAQIAHVVAALAYMQRGGLAAVEPRAEAQAAFVHEVDRLAAGTVWTSGGCDSWYLDAGGRNVAIWPRSVRAFRHRVEPFQPDEYHLRRAPSPELAPDPGPAQVAPT